MGRSTFMRPGPRRVISQTEYTQSALTQKKYEALHSLRLTRGARVQPACITQSALQRKKKYETLQHSCGPGLRRCACSASLNPTQVGPSAKKYKTLKIHAVARGAARAQPA
jgi:hypothetical protein